MPSFFEIYVIFIILNSKYCINRILFSTFATIILIKEDFQQDEYIKSL